MSKIMYTRVNHTFPYIRWGYGGLHCIALLTYKIQNASVLVYTLRKHAYSNIQKISSPKTQIFSDKSPDIFHISAQNIDCGYSLEPPR